jgi:hypothetical protein
MAEAIGELAGSQFARRAFGDVVVGVPRSPPTREP